ncbi:peptide deformylase [Conexibacter sp. DBS9H8]|uniref:peptide deformylase n=1 Tax=Conexibacter sp. DBS9H8 TaxID=2937801 RepID=UPI00200E6716|nr:peptide deformylase [Conexibacter sp. DBS9H8]
MSESTSHGEQATAARAAGPPAAEAGGPSDPVDVAESAELDAEEAIELDAERIARRDAALAHVRTFGDPILREKARPVTVFDDALAAEVAWMGEIMHDGLGIGLAATQVGRLRRLLVYRVTQEGPVTALVNPEIEWHSREQDISLEGCLSLPRIHVEVERPIHVRVRAQDPSGAPLTVEASGLEARVIQHEIDHLDGVLILKRTSREERREALRSLREWQDESGR